MCGINCSIAETVTSCVLSTHRGVPAPGYSNHSMGNRKSTSSCLPTEQNHNAKSTAASVGPEAVQER